MAQQSSGYSKRSYGRAQTLALLDELAAVPSGSDNTTLYLPSSITTAELEQLIGGLSLTPDVEGDICRQIITSGNGAAVFHTTGRTTVISPPFPIKEKLAIQAIDTEQLRFMLTRDYLIALVLVRLGAYAVGICSGEKLVRSKVGTGNIHGRHRQGGSSAHRFERHRDKQIESFLNRTCKHVREVLDPHVKNLDYIVYGGARTTILLLQKYCPLLMKLETPTLPPILDIPDPRQPVLENCIKRIWTTEVVSYEL